MSIIVCLPAGVHLPWIRADGCGMSRKNAQLRRVIWCLSAVIAGLVLVIVPILFVRRRLSDDNPAVREDKRERPGK